MIGIRAPALTILQSVKNGVKTVDHQQLLV